jgi:hypothetical protein
VRGRALGLSLACVLLWPSSAIAAPPEGEGEPVAATGELEGRLRVAGSRAPLAAIKVLVVEAPADATPGRPAREPLDPASVTWVREAMTDDEGRFVLDAMPVGKVRVVVVAPGYDRLEQWAEVVAGEADEVELFLEPDNPEGFRTEVVSRRPVHDARPERVIDADLARVYPGSGGDPLRAAQNLPGMARAPAGVGLIAIRGGDPTQTGIYLDGHPIPRAFHTIPLASVLSPGTTDRVELNAGNYDAAFGGHSAGMIHVHSKSAIHGPPGGIGPRGIHGEAHLDLFDFGGTVTAPAGAGGVTFGFRRSHVGDVIRGVNRILAGAGSSIWVPNYWDYIGRFDHPLRRGQMLTIRAIGAGDTIRDQTEVPPGPASDSLLDFATGFHRFDAAWSIKRERFRFSVSPAIRFDSGRLGQLFTRSRREAQVFSLRTSLAYELTRSTTLLVGMDLVHEWWRRDFDSFVRVGDEETQVVDESNAGRDLAMGLWWGADFHFDTPGGPLVVRPQMRLGVFSDGRRTDAMLDPRLDLRWRVHDRVELLGAIGQYAAPVVRESPSARVGLLQPVISSGNVNIDIPEYLITYFDPDIQGELRRGALLITRTVQGSLGIGAELPWMLRLQATGWWRETFAETRYYQAEPVSPSLLAQSPHRRAYGLEVLLDRPLARDIHGWLGYSLLQSRERDAFFADYGPWRPAVFDQRHNFVALVSMGLPRGFRLGLRFRVVSGNPESAVIGAETVQTPYGTAFRPIRTAFGESYRPVFHQLDLRLDKTWVAKRASVTAYLDIQNVYNRWYPEVYVYSADWRDRSQVIGLPIFPSLGLRVDY